MRKQKQHSASKGMNRMFMIAKVLLTITPVVCYFYVTLLAMNRGMTFQEMLGSEPSLTIIFLIAMVNPYIAYLLQLIQKKLETNDTSFALINMVLLLIAQALTMNVFYFVMLLYVFYKAIGYYRIDVKEIKTAIHIKQSLWNGGGSMLVVMISTLCLFASIRLM